ncbi:hypothetical protein [Paraburkholderia xenovorans]|uniref:hypothetical protein n=1 Tax=Paraburkholderia xenovorans TaxID=36873 RepID=UPI0038B730AB
MAGAEASGKALFYRFVRGRSDSRTHSRVARPLSGECDKTPYSPLSKGICPVAGVPRIKQNAKTISAASPMRPQTIGVRAFPRIFTPRFSKPESG